MFNYWSLKLTAVGVFAPWKSGIGNLQSRALLSQSLCTCSPLDRASTGRHCFKHFTYTNPHLTIAGIVNKVPCYSHFTDGKPRPREAKPLAQAWFGSLLPGHKQRPGHHVRAQLPFVASQVPAILTMTVFNQLLWEKRGSCLVTKVIPGSLKVMLCEAEDNDPCTCAPSSRAPDNRANQPSQTPCNAPDLLRVLTPFGGLN